MVASIARKWMLVNILLLDSSHLGCPFSITLNRVPQRIVSVPSSTEISMPEAVGTVNESDI